jgi:putative Mn2+ efflux pump MntP
VAAVTIGIAIELAKWAGWFAQETVKRAVDNADNASALLALLGC